MPFVYILRCVDESYYVGSTWDLAHRLDQHASGRGAGYTSHRLPVTIVFAQEFERVADAYAMEKRMQGWSRAKREAAIDGRWNDLPRLSRKQFKRDSGD